MKENVWCVTCRGTGQYRRRDQIGKVTIQNCKRCAGKGRISVERGSPEWVAGKDIVTGQWPNNPNKEYR